MQLQFEVLRSEGFGLKLRLQAPICVGLNFFDEVASPEGTAHPD